MTATNTRANLAGWFGLAPPSRFAAEFRPEATCVRGQGIWLQDASGRRYIDARSSLRTATLGHSHPAVVAALRQQLAELQFCPSVGYGRPAAVAVEYAEALAARLSDELRHVRFGNSGSQVVDTAMLLSRFVRRVRGETRRTVVLALRGSFHGAGAGPGALTDDPFVHDYAGPLAGDVRHVSCPQRRWSGRSDLVGAVERTIREVGPERVTALVLEPVLGRSITVFPAAELQRLAELCRHNGIHLIFDEVSTGMGRVGALTRAGQVSVRPDILVLSKGMTSGYVPVGALAVCDELFESVFDVPMPGFPIGSTTDGHPLAMAAGLAVLRVLDDERLLVRARQRGEQLRELLETLRRRETRITDVRGVGLLTVVEFQDADGSAWAPEQVERLRLLAEENGLLLATHESGVEISPPLIISEQECDTVVSILADCLTRV